MIEAKSVRGGIVEEIGGASRSLVLRIGEIERFEDMHRSIYAVRNGMFRGGNEPTSKEIRDLIALGLVGGGMKDAEADKVVDDLLTESGLATLELIALGLVGVAFAPEVGDEVKKEQGENQTDSMPEE